MVITIAAIYCAVAAIVAGLDLLLCGPCGRCGDRPCPHTAKLSTSIIVAIGWLPVLVAGVVISIRKLVRR